MRTKSELPVEAKLDYTTVGGVPTITIAATLTTRGQIEALIGQLEKLANVLPETKVRKRAKAKNGPARVPRQPTHEETTA